MDGILTCHWHHVRFELASGCTFDLWADDVPTCPVEIRSGGFVHFNRTVAMASFTCLTLFNHHLASHRYADEQQLTLRQADQASPGGRDWPRRGQVRTDFAAIESNLEFIMSQLEGFRRGSRWLATLCWSAY